MITWKLRYVGSVTKRGAHLIGLTLSSGSLLGCCRNSSSIHGAYPSALKGDGESFHIRIVNVKIIPKMALAMDFEHTSLLKRYEIKTTKAILNISIRN